MRRHGPAAGRLEEWLSIEADGTVVGRSGKVDYGQGIRTGFAKILAEELALPLERVRIELGETDEVPWDMGTFGSLSTATDGETLRAAAIMARMLLLERASSYFKLPHTQLQLHEGQVVAPDGQAVSFQRLTATAALAGPLAELPAEQSGHRGTSTAPLAHGRGVRGSEGVQVRRLEARDIVLGRPRFSADMRLPGMLFARSLHGPSLHSHLRSFDDREARQMPGVRAIVRAEAFIGVVAEHDPQAWAAIQALRSNWSTAAPARTEQYQITLRGDAQVESALARASLHASASYHLPYIAHAPIAPSAAVADVQAGAVHLYAATQRPFGLRREIAELLSRPEESVHVHPQAMGGMFGRGNVSDTIIEATLLSRAAGHPVLLQWTREEEFRLSPQRPRLDASIHAGLDSSGSICGWSYQAQTNPHTYGSGVDDRTLVAMTAGRNAVPPYSLAAAEIRLEVVPTAIRTGALRSLAAAQHVFAIESFMDELGEAAGQDPISFRQRHLDDARASRVLEAVRKRSGWSTRRRERGRGWGVAFAIYNGTYIAQVVQLLLRPPSIRLERVWCSVDAGRIIWPEGGRNQIEGAIQQAASWALLEQLGECDGRVTSATWHDYPIATCLDAPHEIDVLFIDNPRVEATGLGEPGAVPMAAAIANAIVDAGGPRLRRLPLNIPRAGTG
jgi:CO/xanthine dehydrogenase Mo-binding subunit